MENDSRTVAALIGGAVLGAIAGYFLFTDRGRAMRREIEPAIQDFANEMVSFRDTVQRAVGVATEGWGALTAGRMGGDRYSGPSNVH